MAKQQRPNQNPQRNSSKNTAPQRTQVQQGRTAEVSTAPLPGPWWMGLLLGVLGVALYANTIGHDYTLDDFGAIKENWVVKGRHFGTMLTTEYRYGSWASPGSLYRPLTLMMFSIEWAIGGGAPWVGHLMNMLFYGLSGWVLWITWRRVLADYPWTLAAAMVLIFMAHPVHCEVVANIKSRDEICSLLGSTLGLYFLWRYLGEGRSKWLTWALVSYGLGLFSKESGIMFLFIYPLTMWFFGKNMGEKDKNNELDLSRIVGLAFMFAIPAAIFLLIRWRILSAQNYQETYSILDNFMAETRTRIESFPSAMMMCWKYLAVLFFPHPLVSDMGYPQVKVVSMAHWEAIAGTVAYFGMGIFALLFTARRHPLAYAIWLYLITFSLFSNVIFLIGTSYGERLLYAPSLGFALGVSWLLHWALGRFKANAPADTTLLWSVVGIIVAALALKTLTRNPAWKDSNALYEADYPTSPNCAKLNYHRALEITNHGLDKETSAIKDTVVFKQGLDAFTRCIELYPLYHDAYGSRGLSYFRLQQYDKAFEDYQKALKHRPNDSKVLSNLGFIYFLRAQRPGNQLARAELDSAENVYRRSIQFDPRFVDARRNLGAVLAMKKNFPAAIEQWKEGLKYEPRSVVLHEYIGSAYRDMGDLTAAGPWLEKAQQLKSSPALFK
jgi:protein O-mannosyl-transferase